MTDRLQEEPSELISKYLESEKLTPEDRKKVKEQVAPFVNDTENYLTGKKSNYDLEKNLEEYSVRLLESNLVDGTTFYIDDYGVEFRAEGYIHQSIFRKIDDVIDPISYFLKRIIKETTGKEAELNRTYKGDNQLNLHFDIVKNSELSPSDLKIKHDLERFKQFYMEAVDEGTETLGPIASRLLIYHAAKKYGYQKGDVDNVNVLRLALSNLIGEGGKVVELFIVKKLYKKLDIDFEEREDWNLSDYVEEAKKKTVNKTEGS